MIDAELWNSSAWRQIMAFYRWLKPGLWAMRLPWIGPYLQRNWIKADSDAERIQINGGENQHASNANC